MGAWHAYAEQLSMFYGHVSVPQEVECRTLHLVGSVATTTRVWGLNPEEADCFPFAPEINLWWLMDESPTKMLELVLES